MELAPANIYLRPINVYPDTATTDITEWQQVTTFTTSDFHHGRFASDGFDFPNIGNHVLFRRNTLFFKINIPVQMSRLHINYLFFAKIDDLAGILLILANFSFRHIKFRGVQK
jgi:hypothetical protein